MALNEYAANKLRRAFENVRIFTDEVKNLEIRIMEYNFYIKDVNNGYDKEALKSSIDQMRKQITELTEAAKREELIVNQIMNDPEAQQ